MEIFGGGANDTLIGSTDSDIVFAGGGDDLVDGGDGSDALRGQGGNDTLIGGNGDDLLYGNAGDDLLDGGSGSDRVGYFSGAFAGVTVDLNLQGQAQNTGQGMDTLANVENVSGTAYGDVLTGDSNANWLWGSGDVGIVGNDTIFAGGGDDLVQVSIGDHRLDGGAGVDTLSFDGNGSPAITAGVSVALWAQGGSQATGEGSMTITGFENLSGYQFADTFVGDGGNNVLAGHLGDDNLVGFGGDDLLLGDGAIGIDGSGSSGSIVVIQDFGAANGLPGGNDTLNGGAGADTLIGGGGADALRGGTGDDLVVGDDGVDDVRGQDGNDTLQGGSGSDFLNGGLGDDSMDGGAGLDRAAFFTDAVTGVTVDLNLQGVAQNTGQGWDTLVSIENVSGTPFSDVITGDGGSNWLWGSGQDTTVGNDTIFAGGGDDLVQVAIGDHVLDGGSGVDTLSFNGNGDPVFVAGVVASLAAQGAPQATGQGLMTITGFENLTGYNFADTLTGDSGSNMLAGGLGSDILGGGDGNDILLGDGQIAFVNTADGGAGAITVTGDLAQANGVVGGDDTLTGGNGNDTLLGGDGDDLLDGGDGADRIVVSTTAGHVATVTLGAGADTLLLDTDLQVGATATVTDFQTGIGGDALSLEPFLTSRTDWVSGTDPFAGGYVRLVQDGADTRLELDVDGSLGPAGFVPLATFQNTSALAFDAGNLGGFAPAVSGSSGGDALVYTPDAFTPTGGTPTTLDGGAGVDTLAITTPPPALMVGPATITPSADGKSLLFDLNGDGITDLQVTNVEDIVLNGQQVVISGNLANSGLAPDTIYYNGTDGNDLLDAGGLISLESIRASGGKGNDTLVGANDDDTLKGGDGADLLKGRGGPDVLDGGNGKDTLEGGAGDDILRGGTGNDLLTGGGGADRFEIQKGGGTDRILDFTSGSDGVPGDTLYFEGGAGPVTWVAKDLDGDGLKNDLVVTATGPGGLTVELIGVSTLHQGDWTFI
ncbi:MAG TPA: calcium-binding protein [Phenylobacterium sp.]|nr:calcium-binding protein [Phenylobacterium sp.]